MNHLFQDLKLAFRSLLKRPGYMAIVVLTLGLGIGSNTAMFSVVNGVLLKPLAYRDPDHLMLLWETRDGSDVSVSWLDFKDWQAQSGELFEKTALFQPWNFNLVFDNEPEHLSGYRVTADLFSTLGVLPLHGRAFSAQEDSPGGDAVVLISHALWQRRFGGNPSTVGKVVRLNNASFTVVGIMPPGFRFYQDADLWVPIGHFLAGEEDTQNRSARAGAYVAARLRPGVTVERARRGMSTIAGRLAQAYPATNTDYGAAVMPIQEEVVGDIRHSLLVLLGAVGFVLLIACSNVANLLAVRASMRTREVSIRTALGAPRARLVAQFITESVVLGLLGGLTGVLLTTWCIHLLVLYDPGDIPRLEDVSIDGRVLGFALVVSLITGFLFGLVPIVYSWSLRIQEQLREGGGGSVGGGTRWHRIRQSLVAVEIALSLILFIGAALMVQSFSRLVASSPGYDYHNVLTLDVLLPDGKYQDEPSKEFFRQLVTRVRALPGVQAAAMVTPLPLSGRDRSGKITIEGRPVKGPDDIVRTDISPVSPDYFRILKIPVLRGRAFQPQDSTGVPVVVVDETLAKRFWPGQDPIGKRLKRGASDSKKPWLTVIGVIGHILSAGVQKESKIQMYVPFDSDAFGAGTLVVSSKADAASLAPSVRRLIHDMDSEAPVYNVRMLEDLFSKSVAKPRFLALLLTSFAFLALFLSVIGVYGVASYTVSQRTREIGLRMAMGARGLDIHRLVMAWAVVPIVVGVGIGLVGAMLMTRIIASLLYKVDAGDPSTFVIVPLILVAAGFLGSLLPAVRAARVSPTIALRYD